MVAVDGIATKNRNLCASHMELARHRRFFALLLVIPG